MGRRRERGGAEEHAGDQLERGRVVFLFDGDYGGELCDGARDGEEGCSGGELG